MWSLIDPFRETLSSLCLLHRSKVQACYETSLLKLEGIQFTETVSLKCYINNSKKKNHTDGESLVELHHRSLSSTDPMVHFTWWESRFGGKWWCYLMAQSKMIFNSYKLSWGEVPLLEESQTVNTWVNPLNYLCVLSGLKMNTQPWSQLPQRLSDSFPPHPLNLKSLETLA